MLKLRVLGLIPKACDTLALAGCPRNFSSNMFLGDADVGLGTTLWESLVWNVGSQRCMVFALFSV